jgi:hypothetical protein
MRWHLSHFQYVAGTLFHDSCVYVSGASILFVRTANIMSGLWQRIYIYLTTVVLIFYYDYIFYFFIVCM